MNKIYFEETKNGKEKVIEQPNGIKIRLLKEPSEWYKEKQKKNAEREAIRKAEKQIIKDKETLIKNKMRDLAIEELKKEGKI